MSMTTVSYTAANGAYKLKLKNTPGNSDYTAEITSQNLNMTIPFVETSTGVLVPKYCTMSDPAEGFCTRATLSGDTLKILGFPDFTKEKPTTPQPTPPMTPPEKPTTQPSQPMTPPEIPGDDTIEKIRQALIIRSESAGEYSTGIMKPALYIPPNIQFRNPFTEIMIEGADEYTKDAMINKTVYTNIKELTSGWGFGPLLKPRINRNDYVIRREGMSAVSTRPKELSFTFRFPSISGAPSLTISFTFVATILNPSNTVPYSFMVQRNSLKKVSP